MRIAIFVLIMLAQSFSALAYARGSTSKDNGCIAWEMPSRDTILNSNKKVFAHYFYPFPIRMDNNDWAIDYWQKNYLSIYGENNKWLAKGGYLRTRPSRERKGPSTYKFEDLKREINQAIDRGVNGFTFNILAMSNIDPGGIFENMLTAKEAVDSRFSIVLMPDMSVLNLSNVITIAQQYHDDDRVFHLNGKVVISPFAAERYTGAEWAATIATLSGQGIEIAFFPTFLYMGQVHVDNYAAISVGLGTFGTPDDDAYAREVFNSGIIHAAGKLYMAGLSPQGYRPKSYVYWENAGSQGYRTSWNGAIDGGAEWIQLTTWNDHSEITNVAPFIGKDNEQGTGFYNLTGYYASRFITGSWPEIDHDVLYYFYRRQSTTSPAPNAGQATVLASGSGPASNKVEVLGFLKSPGTLGISFGSTSQAVEAGVHSVATDLIAGTPEFSLTRGGNDVIRFSGDVVSVGNAELPNGYNDFTYWSSSASKDVVCR